MRALRPRSLTRLQKEMSTYISRRHPAAIASMPCRAVSYEQGTPARCTTSLERIYRGTPLMRKRTSLGPDRRPMPRVLGGS